MSYTPVPTDDGEITHEIVDGVFNRSVFEANIVRRAEQTALAERARAQKRVDIVIDAICDILEAKPLAEREADVFCWVTSIDIATFKPAFEYKHVPAVIAGLRGRVKGLDFRTRLDDGQLHLCAVFYTCPSWMYRIMTPFL